MDYFKDNPDRILYVVLVFSWLEYAWETFLGFRQRKIYTTHVKPPPELKGIVDDETFDKARTYALHKSSFGAVKSLFSMILSTMLIWMLAYKLIWDFSETTNLQLLGFDSEIWRTMTFVFYLNVYGVIVELPFSIYETFVLEEKHGFNQQTAVFYVKDHIKMFLISNLISLPLTAAVVKIIHWGGDYFFVYLWGFVVVFTLFMMIVYPELIAPLFDKYTPLPEGSLRTGIEELAASLEFPLYKLFVVEGSKRSSHSNAYFYGFHKFKRIVLFDTLLDESERAKLKTDEDDAKDAKSDGVKSKGCTPAEILAVLGHELGHWKFNHVMKNIVISQVHIFMMFALFGYLYTQQYLYQAFGFEDERPVLVGLMIILKFITAPFNALLNFAMTALSRRFEFQADDFAATELGKSKDLQSALIKLNNDNLGFPIYDWLFSAWHHSHPPLLERLAALKDKVKRD